MTEDVHEKAAVGQQVPGAARQVLGRAEVEDAVGLQLVMRKGGDHRPYDEREAKKTGGDKIAEVK